MSEPQKQKQKQTFVNFHLAISRAQYESARKIGVYDDTALKSPGLNIKKVDDPDYDTFSALINGVGGPWGWTRRPRYHTGNRDEIENVLKHPKTELYLLRKDHEVIGYCLVTAGKNDFTGAFPGSKRLEERFRSIIEIENFGLFPEHTGKGYGRFFLPLLFENLLARYNVVYLSSRSTNHNRVIPFYENLGMRVLHKEELPDDLLPAEKVPQQKPPLPFSP